MNSNKISVVISVWNHIVIGNQRKVVLSPFTSDHYDNATYVSLCDYFEFPHGITCSHELPNNILRRIKCYAEQCPRHKQCFKSEAYGILSNSSHLMHFATGTVNLKTVECVFYKNIFSFKS